MRMILAAAALAALAPLAACGEGSAFDEQFKTSFREKGVETCTSQARAAAPTAAGAVDFQRICACAVDRMMAGKSASELMAGPAEGDEQRAVEQCIAEIVPGAPGGAAPAAAAPAPAPAAPPAPGADPAKPAQ